MVDSALEFVEEAEGTEDQLDELFAPGQQIVMVTPTAWTWHALENGMLSSTERALLRAAR